MLSVCQIESLFTPDLMQTVIVTASAESEASRTSSEGVVAEVSPHLVEEDDIIGWELVLNRAEEETPSMPEATGLATNVSFSFYIFFGVSLSATYYSSLKSSVLYFLQ